MTLMMYSYKVKVAGVLRYGQILPCPKRVPFGNDLRFARGDGDNPVTDALAVVDAAHGECFAEVGVKDAECIRHPRSGSLFV